MTNENFCSDSIFFLTPQRQGKFLATQIADKDFGKVYAKMLNEEMIELKLIWRAFLRMDSIKLKDRIGQIEW